MGIMTMAAKALLSIAGKMNGKTANNETFAQFLSEANREDRKQAAITDPMKQHAWYNTGVTAIARNLSRTSFKLYYRGEEDTNSEFYRLFMNVNPTMSSFQLHEATAGWLNIRGEAIWTFGADYSDGIPKNIYVVNPANFSHVLSKDGSSIALWVFRSGSTEIPFLPNELIHFRTWNPWDDWRGVSPVIAANEEMSQDVKSNRSNSNMLDNGAITPGILTSEQRLSKDEAQEIRVRWRKLNSGWNNHHNIAVLGKGTNYQEIGLRPADMQYIEMKGWNRDTIMARLGVQPGVVGYAAENTPLSGSEKIQATQLFWWGTIIPLQHLIEDKLRTDFFGRLGYDGLYSAKYDNSAVPELQEDNNKKAERQLKELSLGALTIDEYRSEQGREPVPWGGTWWKPPLLSPVDDAGNNQPIEEPDAGKSLDELFFKSRTKSVYTSNFRNKHWWELIAKWEIIETRYKKDLQAWFKFQRSSMLETLYQKALTDLDKFFDDEFWKSQEEKLKDFSNENLTLAVDATGEQMLSLFAEIGIERSFSIYDTQAIKLLENRVNKGNLSTITDTIRKEIQGEIEVGIRQGKTEEQMGDDIRAVYNKANNRAATIARTELGGVINDSRIASFKDVGFKKHSWLSAQDGGVRETHAIDGETVNIGAKFSNGLEYPSDPAGDAAEVINCRCITLPED